ncbi:hypothetical protein LR948_04080 [Roseivivax sp. GX 12232]|uniref:hypothetical protein n=1 Tax=Roseivivax sp. GX 12232 TaxID=2900547 RepID=UPI001E54D042|nr:hypothetical protein [Roseivivax sp. GX 12232]MCE0504519.1 hypothetical protein [Roseivivax sp. GX 12232]
MENAFSPDPLLLTLIFVKRFVFLEVLLVLAVLRFALAEGAARLVALGVALLCALFILVSFAPALGLQGLPFYGELSRLMAAGQGLRLLFGLSALFFLSALLPSRARGWIDLAHMALLTGFLGLWAASLA